MDNCLNHRQNQHQAVVPKATIRAQNVVAETCQLAGLSPADQQDALPDQSANNPAMAGVSPAT